tara:strand:+ start:896 stop:1324 length:429 start_codon:yes stop_codon:yes gene_type:complete
MLGKAEYVKFVLRSLCEERARIFVSDKIVAGKGIQNLSSKSTIDFLNKEGWYQEFIEDLKNTASEEFVKLYRFAAFVSSNISENGKKDKFDIKKSDDGDDTAAEHAEEFSKKGKLTNFEQVPGEWHLQGIFISVVDELKEAL